MGDHINISGIEILANVGVPDEERESPQRIEVTIDMGTSLMRAGRTDDLSQTIDYFQVQQETIRLVQSKPRKLIETVAEEVAQMILKTFRPEKVTVSVKKFILANTRSVSVTIKRDSNS